MRKVDTTDSFERLIKLIDKYEADIKGKFISSVNAVKSDLLISELVDLLENNRINEALDLIVDIPISISTSVNLSYVETGNSTAKVIAQVAAVPVFFDQTNIRAANFMRSNHASLVREFTNEQRQAATEAIIDGITRGINPREQARNFRNSVGLTAKQQQSVINFRNMLLNRDSQVLRRKLRDRRFDPSVLASLEGRRNLTPAQIEKMVDRYRERFIKFRAEVIARTEALRSIHEANDDAYLQAIQAGQIDESLLEREWVTTRDSRLRDSHRPMHGQTRAFGEKFRSGFGNLLMFPGDRTAPISETAQCRCSVITRFKEI